MLAYFFMFTFLGPFWPFMDFRFGILDPGPVAQLNPDLIQMVPSPCDFISDLIAVWELKKFYRLWPVLRKRDVYPGSWFLPIPISDPGSRILDPGSRIQKPQQKREVKKFVVIPFFVATNFTKLKIILFLKCWEKNLAQFSKNYRTFYPKICH